MSEKDWQLSEADRDNRFYRNKKDTEYIDGLHAEVKKLQAESEAFRGKLAEQCGQTLVARAEVERLKTAEVHASTAYMLATNRNQHYEAEIKRLNKMLDWCDKMEPGIKRRAEIAIEDEP